jgi:hypothetical protein
MTPALFALHSKSHRTIDPQCLENPRPEGAESTLTKNAASPFPAEPRQIRRGSFRSVEDLEKAIAEFLAAWNEKPKPFIWTATVESIVEKLSRCRQTLEKIKPGSTLPRRRKAKR